jgi:hypothetical protein
MGEHIATEFDDNTHDNWEDTSYLSGQNINLYWKISFNLILGLIYSNKIFISFCKSSIVLFFFNKVSNNSFNLFVSFTYFLISS